MIFGRYSTLHSGMQGLAKIAIEMDSTFLEYVILTTEKSFDSSLLKAKLLIGVIKKDRYRCRKI